MTTGFCLVLSTCPDEDTAQSLARGLVAERLAACVNIVPGLLSVYRWQGEIETASEHLLVIKTESAAFETVKSYLCRHHPYELPEIVAVPVDAGSPEYLHWLSACLRPESAS